MRWCAEDARPGRDYPATVFCAAWWNPGVPWPLMRLAVALGLHRIRVELADVPAVWRDGDDRFLACHRTVHCAAR